MPERDDESRSALEQALLHGQITRCVSVPLRF
jgi:hypothetical protein